MTSVMFWLVAVAELRTESVRVAVDAAGALELRNGVEQPTCPVCVGAEHVVHRGLSRASCRERCNAMDCTGYALDAKDCVLYVRKGGPTCVPMSQDACFEKGEDTCRTNCFVLHHSKRSSKPPMDTRTVQEKRPHHKHESHAAIGYDPRFEAGGLDDAENITTNKEPVDGPPVERHNVDDRSRARAQSAFEYQGCFRAPRNASSPLAHLPLHTRAADGYFDPLRCRANCVGSYVGLLGGTTCVCIGDAFGKERKKFTQVSKEACDHCTSCFSVHTKFPCTSKAAESEELLCDKCHPGHTSCDARCSYCGAQKCRCGSADHMAVYSLGELPRQKPEPALGFKILTPHPHAGKHAKEPPPHEEDELEQLERDLAEKAKRAGERAEAIAGAQRPKKQRPEHAESATAGPHGRLDLPRLDPKRKRAFPDAPEETLYDPEKPEGNVPSSHVEAKAGTASGSAARTDGALPRARAQSAQLPVDAGTRQPSQPTAHLRSGDEQAPHRDRPGPHPLDAQAMA